MSAIMSDTEIAESWPRQAVRSVARLLGIALGIGLGTVLLGAAMLAVFGSADASPAADQRGSQRLECFAGIPPVGWLVERIGGPLVHVEVLVQPGQDPHVFSPTPRQAIALGKARLFFRIGIPFEDLLMEHLAERQPSAAVGAVYRPNDPSAKPVTVVDTAAGIARRASSDEDDGPGDPHVWLSPPLLKTMAANVAASLSQADPRHEHVYRTNLKALDDELDELDRFIAKSLTPGQTFYVFHPAFGYFADRYGLRQESVEVEGKPPTPRQVFALVRKARAERVKIIFLQPQFNEQIAASIAQAIGGAVMPMDDLAFDVVKNLKVVAQRIANANRERAE
jgi:zinc transport system substrate-binding protein